LSAAGAGAAGTVRVATLNCRNTVDRWYRRRSLLVRQLVDLAPDVIGLQELRTLPDQSAWIARRAGPTYRRHRTPKAGLAGLWEGIAVLSRLPVLATASLELGGQHRVAQRVTVSVPGSRGLEIYNAHLVAGDEPERQKQVIRLLAWMDERPGVPQVLLGDFNATPAMASVQLLFSRLRSVHVAVHGAEPPRTLPTPLRAGASASTPGLVMDYIFVNGLLEVHDARVVFDDVDPHDPGLAASDHYGLTATVSVRPAAR